MSDTPEDACDCCDCCESLDEAKDLMTDCANLIDDLMFCAIHPNKDPCDKRKSTRTRDKTLDDALEIRNILWAQGDRR